MFYSKILPLVAITFSSGILADQAEVTPKALINNLSGCYGVDLGFKEGSPTKDSFNRMKELVTVEEQDDLSLVVSHTTIVDEYADGEDPIIRSYQLNNDPNKNPIVFEHLTEIWQPEVSGEWTQVTLAPYSRREVFRCTGSWIANTFSCNIPGVHMLRRDRVKDRNDFSTMDIDQDITISSPGTNASTYSVVAQRNIKRNDVGEAVSIESGWIEYKKLEDEACAAVTNRNSL